MQAAAIAAVGTPLIEALGATLPVARARAPSTSRESRAPAGQPILAFWHGRILAAHAVLPRPRRSSSSRARTSTASGSRGSCGGSATARRAGRRRAAASRALVQLRRDLARGSPAAFTVDGPRGPARVAQPGAVWLASATGNPIVPFHIEAVALWTMQQLGSASDSEARQPTWRSRSASRSTWPATSDDRTSRPVAWRSSARCSRLERERRRCCARPTGRALRPHDAC